MQAIDFLQCVPLFQQLPGIDLENLSDSLKTQVLKKGEILFRKGEEGATLYIIQEGKIKISLLSCSGDEVVLVILTECDFFGEMALLDGLPRSADATAIEPTRLLLLEREDFLNFLNDNKRAMQAALFSLSQRLRRTDDLLQDTCFLNIPGRFAKKLIELVETYGHRDGNMAHIELPLTQKELGGMVGATRESINKELRLLKEKGLVSIHEGTISVHNLERLRRRAH